MSHAAKSDVFLPFARPEIGEEAIQDVVTCLRSGWLVTGPKVQQFEQDLKTYCQSPHAFTLSSATVGLFFAIQSLNLQEGDEVITTSLTFAATANAIAHAKAKPVFVDIVEGTRNLDINQVEKAITSRTKAILPVHFAGLPVDLDPLYALADQYGLIVVEDAAHAIGADYKGKRVGSFGHTQIFSFYANKNMTTGEGGCLVTRDETLAEKIKLLRFHGIDRDTWDRYSKKGSQDYDIIYPGYKANMMDIQAILGIHQLAQLDNFIKRRRILVERYQEAFKDWDAISLPQMPSYECGHAWHLYTVLMNPHHAGVNREEFIDKMKEENIGTGLHYHPVHLYTYYRKTFGYKEGDLPVAESVGERIVSLPLFPSLSFEEQDRVIETMSKIFKRS